MYKTSIPTVLTFSAITKWQAVHMYIHHAIWLVVEYPQSPPDGNYIVRLHPHDMSAKQKGRLPKLEICPYQLYSFISRRRSFFKMYFEEFNGFGILSQQAKSYWVRTDALLANLQNLNKFALLFTFVLHFIPHLSAPAFHTSLLTYIFLKSSLLLHTHSLPFHTHRS